MKTYEILLGKKTKIIAIEHYFPNDMPGFMVIIKENKDRLFLNLNKVSSIEIEAKAFAEQDDKLIE